MTLSFAIASWRCCVPWLARSRTSILPLSGSSGRASDGADVIPRITVAREWDRAKRVADSQGGRHVRDVITQLEHLIEAY